jgi:leader peptidase (prepilin peptidase)/N-methyltransferase
LRGLSGLIAGAVCAVAGVALGPTLASLAATAPADGALLDPSGWRGRPADRRHQVATSVLAAVVFGLLGARIGFTPALPAYTVAAGTGVVLAAVDVRHHRLPDRILLPALGGCAVLLGLAAAVEGQAGALVRAGSAAAATFGTLFGLAMLGPGALGFGDVKLGALLGLVLGWLSWSHLVLGLLLGLGLAALMVVVLLAARRIGLRSSVPLGPALLAGGWLVVVLPVLA